MLLDAVLLWAVWLLLLPLQLLLQGPVHSPAWPAGHPKPVKDPRVGTAGCLLVSAGAAGAEGAGLA